MLADNIVYLKRNIPDVYNFLKENGRGSEANGIVITDHQTRSGLPTLQVSNGTQSIFIHSKYDPKREAVQWVESLGEEINKYDHIFIYGIGYAYHIEALIDMYPSKSFSLYEPRVEIFNNLMYKRNFSEIAKKKIENIYIEYVPNVIPTQLEQFIKRSKEKVLLLIHPVYGKLFGTQVDAFQGAFKNIIANHRSHFGTNLKYEKLWTLNGLSNFVKVLETPSVLRLDKQLFQNKPALLVGAGPSLQEEMDNIRKIKESGSAYIFAIGSANRALIKNGIYPDAITTYDPNTINVNAFEEIINNNIIDIPLIFGSSVGYSTIVRYPGPLLHMITTQDTLGNYFLSSEELARKGELIFDAPTIAVVTLQMLCKLNCNPIILVGQNFGFKNDQYYTKGINYPLRTEQLTDVDKNNILEVEGAEGGLVQTSALHNMGRIQMENYLKHLIHGFEIINTTKGGAKINGTTFIELETVMADRLLEPVVVSGWHLNNGRKMSYNLDAVKSQAKIINSEYNHITVILDEITRILKKINMLVVNRESNQLFKQFPKFDKVFKMLEKNKYYEVFLRPMLRVEYELLSREIEPIKRMVDKIGKGEKVVEVFGKYVYEIQKTFTNTQKMYESLYQIIMMTEEQLSAKAEH